MRFAVVNMVDTILFNTIIFSESLQWHLNKIVSIDGFAYNEQTQSQYTTIWRDSVVFPPYNLITYDKGNVFNIMQ